MGLATLVFWLGRWKFAHLPPAGVATVVRTLRGEGKGVLARLLGIYFFVAMFWSLYDQSGSAYATPRSSTLHAPIQSRSAPQRARAALATHTRAHASVRPAAHAHARRWVQQADHMDRRFLGFEWLPSQLQAVNALLILLYIPLFNGFELPTLRRRAVVEAGGSDSAAGSGGGDGGGSGGGGWRFPGLYGFVGRCVRLTALRKISAGFFLCALAFAVATAAQSWIDAGQTPSVAWQLLACARPPAHRHRRHAPALDHALASTCTSTDARVMRFARASRGTRAALLLTPLRRPRNCRRSYAILTASEILVSITCLEFSYTQVWNWRSPPPPIRP